MSSIPLRAPKLLGLNDGPSDEALVQRALTGDEFAFDLLYRRHVQFVAAVVQRVCGKYEDLEDIVQETFTVAFAKLGSLSDPKALRGWLAQIAMSHANRRGRWFRRLRLFRSAPEERATVSAMVSSTASPDIRAQLSQIDAALERIPSPERTAWVLRYGFSCTLEEVAKACSCSLATAKRRLAKASASMGPLLQMEEIP